VKTTTSFNAVENSDKADWRRPISTTYLVMIRRYLSSLRDNSPMRLASFDAKPTEESIESLISMKKLVPIFSELEKKLGHKAFGVDIGRYMHPSDYGIFGYFLMNFPTIGLSLENAARVKSIRNGNMTASVCRSGGQFSYEISTEHSDVCLDILVELDYSMAFQFGKLLVGPHCEDMLKLDSVHFKHSPLGPKEIYEERFACPVYFDQERNCAKMTEEVANLPVYAANPKILTVLEHKIDTLLSRELPKEKSLSERVQMYLNNLSSSTFPSSSQLAEAFNMSLSSLKKHLKEEGTCYQDICEEVRKTKSFKLLSQKDLPIKSIAFELGFSNPSAFNRAFKRWTGDSPQEYRKAQGYI
jgi:AraC-like DNA-binding protein